MQIEVTLCGSIAYTRQQIIKQYASLANTISFDDERRMSVFACDYAEVIRLCINLPPRVAEYNWQNKKLWIDLNAFNLGGNAGWNDITQSSILPRDARQ